MWFGKNKTLKETKEAGKKEFAEEVKAYILKFVLSFLTRVQINPSEIVLMR